MAQNLKIHLLAIDKTKQAFNSVTSKLDKVKKAVFSVKGALVGIGTGVVVKQFVDVGRSVEDLQVRLKALFGSTQEGAKAFDVMSNFASKVPFSLEQIQQASGNLAVVAKDADELAKILEITGNVASVTGLDFAQTAEQIQRSFSGGIASADVFRERGVRQMLGFSAGATVSAEETIKAFEKVFGKGGQFGNTTEELANTFTGTLSMLGDSFFNFKKNVADQEFFDTLKKEFSDLDKFIKENQATFDDIADVIGTTLAGAVKLLSASIKAIAKSVDFVTTAYENLILTLNKIPYVDIKIKTKEQRDIERQIGEIEKERFGRMKSILKVQEQINLQAKAEQNIKKEITQFTSISNRENFEIANSMTKQKSLSDEVLDKIKNQNKEFSLSNEIFNGIKSATSSFSRSLAEALVLGKSINVSMRELAKSLLVEIIAKTIERIALKKIEKILDETLFKKEQDKTREIDRQNSKLKQQLAIRTALSFFGGGIGSFFGGFFANGGAVSKGQPIVVGERGPELFVPNQTGQITQNARGTGNGGATTVNFNITTVDAKGFDELLVARRGTISRIINESVNERGREALI